MIDLKNTCVLIKTPEENEKLLKEAEKQGFHWTNREGCEPLREQPLPDVLKFYKDKSITVRCNISSEYTFHEASEILGMKEMTAREFAERIADVSNCCERKCEECVLDKRNNKCKKNLCSTRNWKDNINELLEITKAGKGTVPTPKEKAINTLEKFIENTDRASLNDEFVNALNLLVEKLKEVK